MEDKLKTLTEEINHINTFLHLKDNELQAEYDLRNKNQKIPLIYTSVFNNENIDNNFFNIVDNDILEKNIDVDSIIDKVYLKLSRVDIKIIENIIFNGIIILDEVNYNFKFILEKNTKYIDEINKLEISGYNCRVEFNKFDTLHIDRMYNIKVIHTEYTGELKNCEIIYRFGKFEKNILFNTDVYWNIENITLISNSVPIISAISSKYLHTIYTSKANYVYSEDMYISDYTLKELEDLVKIEILTDSISNKLKFYKIHPIKNPNKYLLNEKNFQFNINSHYYLKIFFESKKQYRKYFTFKSINNKTIYLYTKNEDEYIGDYILEIEEKILTRLKEYTIKYISKESDEIYE